MFRALLGAVTVLLLAVSATAQTVYDTSGGERWLASSGTTESQSLTLTAGDCVVFATGWATTTSTITSATVGGSAATLIDSSSDGTNGTLSTYRFGNSGSGATSISVTWSADPGIGYLIGYAFKSCDSSATLDGHQIGTLQVNPGTGTDAITSGAITTTANGDAVVGFFLDTQSHSGTITLGTGGWANLVNPNTSGWTAGEQQVQTTAGSITATFTNTATLARDFTAIVAVKAAGGATPGCKNGLLLLGTGCE